ncbi:MAG: histidine kinase, partial [Methyloversatilis sp.]|nr:histidine kinase [Methyloversatilis sp.]
MAINTCYGASTSTDPVRAVAELAAQTGSTDKDGLLFFCSPDVDLAVLGRELARTYRCPTVGCTSSGHFGPAGFQRSG